MFRKHELMMVTGKAKANSRFYRVPVVLLAPTVLVATMVSP